MIQCKKCRSEKYVKSGKARWHQKYLCKECGCNFIERDRRTNEKIKARKAMCIFMYAQGKTSINKIAKTLGLCWSLVYRWIKEAAESLEEYTLKLWQAFKTTHLLDYLRYIYICLYMRTLKNQNLLKIKNLSLKRKLPYLNWKYRSL